ncbi:MAG TPA: hypothetical protein VK730_13375 [Solirubrobacteraceae bacterium]|jgi:hypothetical protein|nr:hypothetical protein [Solirubrobacteraceae bacterium]
MKRTHRVALGACLAMLALTGTSAASASASEFVFSKTGTLKGTALSAQKFNSSGGKWECSKETISGSATVSKTTIQKITVQYEGCVYFGVLLKAAAAEFELNTSGSLTLLKKFTMSSSLCTIGFQPGTYLTLNYANKPAGKIEIAAEVNKITTYGSGSLCSYSENSNGTLVGTSLLELEGGTAEVK